KDRRLASERLADPIVDGFTGGTSIRLELRADIPRSSLQQCVSREAIKLRRVLVAHDEAPRVAIEDDDGLRRMFDEGPQSGFTCCEFSCALGHTPLQGCIELADFFLTALAFGDVP